MFRSVLILALTFAVGSAGSEGSDNGTLDPPALFGLLALHPRSGIVVEDPNDLVEVVPVIQRKRVPEGVVGDRVNETEAYPHPQGYDGGQDNQIDVDGKSVDIPGSTCNCSSERRSKPRETGESGGERGAVGFTDDVREEDSGFSDKSGDVAPVESAGEAQDRDLFYAHMLPDDEDGKDGETNVAVVQFGDDLDLKNFVDEEPVTLVTVDDEEAVTPEKSGTRSIACPGNSRAGSFRSGSGNDWIIPHPKHMDYDTLMTYLGDLNRHFNTSTRLTSIGTSVQNRSIPCLVLCNNEVECRRRPLLKPKFRYTANIHGDEATGRGLVTYLAQFMLTERDTNPRVSELLRSVEIHIVPTLNPDGFEEAYEQYMTGVGGHNVSKGRRNANNKDLNRDFPHIFNYSSPDEPGFWDGRQPETVAYMNQSINELYIIDGNMHTGDLVISIPLDSHKGTKMKPTHFEARPPDFDLFLHLGRMYSLNHPDMHRPDHVCPHTMTSFPDGVVNGAEWYVVTGSAGDFVYKFANALELTIEMSCQKFVEEDSFPAEWDKNRGALLAFMEQSHLGVKGIVRYAASKLPVPFARVEVRNRRQRVFANGRGEYFRALLDGRYEVRARAGETSKPSPWVGFDVFNINGPTVVVIEYPFPPPARQETRKPGGTWI